MQILLEYGAHAQAVIPELNLVADYFEDGEENFPRRLSVEKARIVLETIRAIEDANDKPELISIE